MGFRYTNIKFFIRQKLVTNIPYAHFPWRVLWRYFALRHLLILMCQPKAHWLFKQWVFLSQWLACLNNKHNVYKQEISLYFFTASKHNISVVRLDYACTLSVIWKWSLPSLWSYLPWWLWPRPTKQVWITYTVVNQPRFHGSKIY